MTLSCTFASYLHSLVRLFFSVFSPSWLFTFSESCSCSTYQTESFRFPPLILQVFLNPLVVSVCFFLAFAWTHLAIGWCLCENGLHTCCPAFSFSGSSCISLASHSALLALSMSAPSFVFFSLVLCGTYSCPSCTSCLDLRHALFYVPYNQLACPVQRCSVFLRVGHIVFHSLAFGGLSDVQCATLRDR